MDKQTKQANQRQFLMRSAYWGVYAGLTSTYIIAFALLLGASNTMVGLLGAVPFLAVLVAVILGAKLTEYWARIPIIMFTYAIDKLMWVLIAFIPFVGYKQPLFMLVMFFFANSFFEMLRQPAIVSLEAELVEKRSRGRYFSKVSRATAFTGMIAMVAAGGFVTLMGDTSQLAYAIIFGTGAAFGYFSMWAFGSIKDERRPRQHHYSLQEIFKVDGAFRGFCWRASIFWFSVRLASPLVAAYVLRDLGLSTFTFGIIFGLVTFVRIITFKPLGLLADRYGDRVIAVIGVFGTSFVMFLWFIIRPGTLWLLWPTQIIAGIAWAATEISILNILFDVTNARQRPLQTAQYDMFVATAQTLGPLTGGWLADNGHFFMLAGVPLVFMLSFVLRAFSGVAFFSMREPRLRKQYTVKYVLHRVVRENIFGHFHRINYRRVVDPHKPKA